MCIFLCFLSFNEIAYYSVLSLVTKTFFYVFYFIVQWQFGNSIVVCVFSFLKHYFILWYYIIVYHSFNCALQFYFFFCIL